jgi:hypothetical protein
MARIIKLFAVAALMPLSILAQPPSGVPQAQTKAAQQARHRKAKPAPVKETPPPPPTPIPQMTPEQLPAQPPQVSYRNGQLNVVSQNATLGDVLNAIRQQTGAQIDPVPGGSGERVALRLSGTPREVISSLLDGSRFGYIIVGSPGDPGGVQKVMLTANSTQSTPPGPQAANARPQPQPAQAWTPPPDYTPDVAEEEAPDPGVQTPADAQAGQVPPQPGMPPSGQPGDQVPNPYIGGEQPRAGQPTQINPQNPQNPDQPQIKTPDQLLQELQRLRQRQQQPNPQ